MFDKSKLGTRYACFQCGTKFYDLNRPEPTCPDCGADQREAPVRDIKALLAGRKNRGGGDDLLEDQESGEDEDMEDFLDDDTDDVEDDEDDEEAFEEDE
ncbi:MAG TPA: FYDLN acid domain-containing protein [Myxococcota bacterium]|nr:FYDLN acid domain-containing protein [Myxococcota bacterium]